MSMFGESRCSEMDGKSIRQQAPQGRMFKSAVALLGLLAGLSMGAGSAVAQEVKLTFITGYPFSGPSGNLMYGAKKFIEVFNQRAKGKAQIHFVGGTEVVAPFDQLKALQNGQFDMGSMTSILFRDLKDIYFIHYMSPAEQVAVGKRGGRELLQKITAESAKVTFLMMVSPGLPFYIWSNKPIATVADAKGVKIRGFAGVNEELQRQLGMVTVNVPSSDVLSSLRSGILDATLRDSVSIGVLGEAEHVKNRTEARLCTCMAELYISTATWNKLSGDVKKLMVSVAGEIEPDSLAFLEAWAADNVKVNEKKFGMKVTKGTPQLNDIVGRKISGALMATAIKDSKYRDEIITTFGLAHYLKD